MLALINRQVLNYSQLANSMGLSQPTIKHYVSILHHTFMLRILPPYFVNIKKRLIKSPKVYIRDNGVLHALLKIPNFKTLYAHPIYGSSWELLVIENVISKYHSWNYYYYRNSTGAEIDLILTKGSGIIAIEIKASTVPKLTKGFWNALEDIKPTQAYVIAQVKMPYPLKENVMVYPLEEFLEKEV
jgi:predicted AAA+ superfamily ATPase